MTGRPGSGTRRLPAACWLLLALAAPLPAQEWQQLGGLEETGVEIRVLSVVGVRTGGQGYVVAEATNHGSSTAAVRVGYESDPWSRGSAEAWRGSVLGPQETARIHLPVPAIPDASARLFARVDGVEAEQQRLEMAEGVGMAALLVTRRPEEQASILALLAGVLGGDVAVRVVDPDYLPPDWTLLSAFDVVLVHRSAALGDRLQELLRRYAVAGGRVVVDGVGRLRPGPLRTMLEPADGVVDLGFGAAAAVTAFEREQAERALGSMLAAGATFAGPATAFLHGEQPIPGLGSTPVRAFLVVILLFGIAVGPVNFWVLRRRRQPLLALLTVPALGCATTVVLLAYGLFHEGFGIQGVLRSYSVLDQQQHEAAAIATRTLYAGLSPNRLQVPAAVMVESLQAATADRGNMQPHRLAWDQDQGTLEGGVLPSRIATTLVASQQGPSRARLRFAARPDGGYELLPDGGYGLARDSQFVLRDPTGGHHLWRDGRLVPCGAGAAQQALAALRTRAGAGGQPTGMFVSLGRGRMQHVDPEVDRAAFLQRWLPATGLEPGTYAGEFGAVPWLADLGLSVHLHAQRHFVVGVCAAEDFVP